MKELINKFGEGLDKTFTVNGNNFALAQYGEDYNGTLALLLNEKEHTFYCYEDGNERYLSRDEALEKLVQIAENI